jgi:superfamily I DNA/RNA helicase
MARMIPTYNPPAHPHAEAKVYRWLAEGLSDAYEVYHSVDLLHETNNGLREAETDFVIVHPTKGLLILEVKGGREIYYDGDTWHSISHQDKDHSTSDPFNQGRDNLHHLLSNGKEVGLWQKEGEIKFPRGYGVVFPDVAWTGNEPLPPDADHRLIRDQRLRRNTQQQIDQLMGSWSGKRGSTADATNQLQTFSRKVLQPTFRVKPSLKLQIAQNDDTFVRLTEEQNKVYNGVLKTNRRALIEGYAGTGKTFLALHRAAELGRDGHRTLFLCFNRHLATYASQQAEDVPNLTVSTFHHLAKQAAARTPGLRFPDRPDQEFWTTGAATLLLDAAERTGLSYDAILVDEAQDFQDAWWVAVQSLLAEDGYFYVFTDPGQNIYHGNLKRELGLPTNICLKENCRSTQEIRSFAASILQRDETSASFTIQGQPVITKSFDAREDQYEQLLAVVKRLKQDEKLHSRDLLLLSPYTYDNMLLADHNHRLGGYKVAPYDPLTPPDQQTLYYESLQAFKGMEAPVVLLFDVRLDSSANTRENMYVATSRAQHVLYVLHEKGWREEMVDRHVVKV